MTPDGVGAQAVLAFMGICFVGSAHFTPDGVRAQAVLAFRGTCFVGSAHTRKGMIPLTSVGVRGLCPHPQGTEFLDFRLVGCRFGIKT